MGPEAMHSGSLLVTSNKKNVNIHKAKATDVCGASLGLWESPKLGLHYLLANLLAHSLSFLLLK